MTRNCPKGKKGEREREKHCHRAKKTQKYAGTCRLEKFGVVLCLCGLLHAIFGFTTFKENYFNPGDIPVRTET